MLSVIRVVPLLGAFVLVSSGWLAAQTTQLPCEPSLATDSFQFDAESRSAKCKADGAVGDSEDARVVTRELREKAASNWELAPFIGMYTPIGRLVSASDPAASHDKRQVGAISVGTRVGLRLSEYFQLEGGVGFTPSLVAVAEPNSVVDLNGHVLTKSARLAGRFGGPTRAGDWTFYFASGYGMVTRLGDAWQGARETTDHALVLAAGIRLAIPGSPLAFRFDCEDFISRVRFHYNGSGRTRGSTHHDVIWSLGLAIPVRGG